MITGTPNVEQKLEVPSPTLHSIIVRICTTDMLWQVEIDEYKLVHDLIIDLCKRAELPASPNDYYLTLDGHKLDINDTIKISGLLNPIHVSNPNYPELQIQQDENDTNRHENPVPYPMASLYIGDLHPDVTEAMLFDKFASAGPVLSIRVCRDAITRQSLGYAYINFQHPASAERALDTMNFDVFHGRPLRIMWSQGDPALRKSSGGDVIIKGLDKNIDNKSLYDTFSAFGNILSCKIMTDENGQSKGFGFVCYETQEAADNAIAKVNGMLLADKKVFVGRLMSRAQRTTEGGPCKLTNIFIKNFDDQLDEEKIRELFSQYGKITNCKIEVDENGKSKGFGFCRYENPEEAEAAVQNLNGYTVGDKQLYVGRFQKKNERISEIKRKKDLQRQERMNKYQGVNLYIKNLDDAIDDERLRNEFSKFGTITSAKVVSENGRSKGFGFVCFSTPDEATKAVTEMNGSVVGSKPLYVALAQRKKEHFMHLTNQHMQRIATSHASSQEEKQMLGERLFPLIQQMQPELAGKITGMLLEIDNTELLHMLESSESLKAKVEEATAVIRAHQAKQMYAAKQAASNCVTP